MGGTDYFGEVLNTLLSLTAEDEKEQWYEVFPPMPTSRCYAACVNTEQALIVAGGSKKDDEEETDSFLDCVEVMKMDTKQWTTVSPLPKKLIALSVITCGDKLYLAGGYSSTPSKSVFACSLAVLLTPSNSFGSRIRRTLYSTWKEVRSLPVIGSTLVSFGGDLLAIGGGYDLENDTCNVYRYDSHADYWTVESQMKNKRKWCLAVALENKLVVVGGNSEGKSIEILE